MSVQPIDLLAVALARDAEELRAAPFRHFKLMSWAQERLVVESFINGLDSYSHWGNSSGKTTTGIFLDVAACTGLDSVRGYFLECVECGRPVDPREDTICPCGGETRERRIALPVVEPPVRWGLGVPSYKIAAGSSLAMIRSMLGRWPNVEIRQGNRNTVAQVLIKHAKSRSDEPDDSWSELYVLPYDGEVPEALRLDGFHCDEPPPEHFLDAMRMRRKAGRAFRRYITATPIDRRTWEPILKQYPKRLLEPVDGRIRIQSSTYDNMALTADDLAGIERDLEGSPLKNARLMGEHVDITGSAAFGEHSDTLKAWLAGCIEPKRERLRGFREVETPEGKKSVEISVEIQVLEAPDPTDVYLITADCGKGIKDGQHDPDCAHVWSYRKRKVVAIFNDYIGGWGLGYTVLAGLGRRYNNARVDPAVTGGYGESVLSGLKDAKYNNITYYDMKQVTPTAKRAHLGFNESLSSNAEWKQAVEAALRLGSVTIQFEDVVRCLMSLVVDENGKVLADAGEHDEHWVCAGRAIYLLSKSSGGARALLARPETLQDRITALVNRTRVAGNAIRERWN